MRLLAVTAAGILLAACSLVVAEPTTTQPATTQPSTSTTSTATTPPPTTTTSVVGDELVTTSCPTSEEGFAALCEAYDLIVRNYVDPIDPGALADAALLGVQSLVEPGTAPGPLVCPVPDPAFIRVCEELEALDVGGDALEAILYGITEFGLDPNSAYIDPDALALLEEEQTGSVEGIGALVTTEDLASDDPANTPCNIVSVTCPLVVVSTMQSGPAATAGVLPGDVFIAVDGTPIAGMSLDAVTGIVRGPAGSDVTITFARDGEEYTVTITRAAIEIAATEAERIGDVGYIRLNSFTGSAEEEAAEDLERLLGDGVDAIVLDLRDNPGGTLDSALGITSQFVEGGVLVRTVGPDEERNYPARDDGLVTDPIVEVFVVVNRGSASASEVLAGALQERGRATIVGERTFGKNTVQQRFPLSNGGAMRITIARWTTGGGLDFDDGIVPDVPLDIPPSATPTELVALVTARS